MPRNENPEPNEVVLLVHGIRTHADWQVMVKRVLQEIPGKYVQPTSYGYFNAFRFWCPFFTRSSAIEEVKETIEQLRIRFPNSKLSVIAHSNGTYIISKLLMSKRDLEINRLVLCGSIVKRRYPWDFVGRRLGSDVINEYGTKDIWPVFAKALSWGYGDTGRYQFGKPYVKDRKHDFAHSDYFGDKEGQGEEFVRKFWKPWFEDGTFVPSEGAGKAPIWLSLLSVIRVQWIVIATLVVAVILALIRPVDCNLNVTSFKFEANTAYFAEADEIKLGEEFEVVSQYLKSCKLIHKVLPANPENEQFGQIVARPTDGLIDQFTYHFINDVLTTITFTFSEESGFEQLKSAAHEAFGPPDSSFRQFNQDYEIWDDIGGRKFSVNQTGGSLFFN